MEGIGSRLGRASSRYGPAPVFSGPVRKWKRQWVHVSSSPSSYHSHSHSHSHSNNNNNHSSALLLCRWTPINHSADYDKNSVTPDEPPRRKFRYTPIVVLEEKKKEVPEKAEDESSPSKTNQSMTRETSETDDIFDKTDIDNLFNEDTQGSNKSQVSAEHSKRSQMDLDLRLKGHDDKSESDGETDEAK